MNQENQLGVEKIHKLLIKFSVPAMVGMIVNSLYNVVDRIFIGNAPDLGANGLAGITIAFPIMIILMSMGILYGMGGATLFSLKMGEGNRAVAEKALGNSLAMLVLTGLVLVTTGQIFLRPILLAFGASETVLPYAVEYMRIIFIGSVFQTGSMGMNNFIRADGNPKVAMITMFFGAGVNIILDPIFIYGFKLGMAGAALATIIAQAMAFAWVMAYFLGKRSNVKIKRENLKPDPKLVRHIIVLGIPAASLQFANSFLNVILNKGLLLYGGDIAVSAMGIINSLKMLLLLPIIGLRQGLQPIVGFNYGAKKYLRVKKAANLGVTAATAISTFSFIITRLFPEQLIGFFNQDPQLLEFGVKALNYWFLFMPLIGIQIIGSSYFQAIGKAKIAMFLTLTRQVILLIPALLIFPIFWRMDGILYSTPFADLVSFIVTVIWFILAMKSLETAENENKNLKANKN
ncbi:MATE family efflux transporter [Alkalibacter mobilis]|uniref:MATE family efflux transporter n=1 Tax=Alkalibacter mobilis TaxID=2787712 RepID=UPI00189C727C|nr:MATE family efflux transporter [Alkalibacter mobilis]MBF7096375.1 MATE family efflux transporter [Alkalibacter mobilis]